LKIYFRCWATETFRRDASRRRIVSTHRFDASFRREEETHRFDAKKRREEEKKRREEEKKRREASRLYEQSHPTFINIKIKYLENLERQFEAQYDFE